MKSEVRKLEDLVNMDSPEAVFSEAGVIFRIMFPGGDFAPVYKACEDIVALFKGDYPGYRGCNIYYHDLKHTTDCLMATTRLIHGAFAKGVRLTERHVCLGLVSSLLHDTGYIQGIWETGGTGAQYTLTHIERSISFMEKYFAGNDYSTDDLLFCRGCLKCTGLDVNIGEIPFESTEHEFLGKALGTADLLGQMADRTYLERLPFLYCEFEEGGVPGFSDELDLLRKTPGFWEFTKKRFAEDLGGVEGWMLHHFDARWGIARDLYRDAIENNMHYLKYVIDYHESDYKDCLRRGGLMNLLRELESPKAAERPTAGKELKTPGPGDDGRSRT